MDRLSRYLCTPILADLKRKMVFVGGPRQVGKTTLALSLLANGSKKHPDYYNWDILRRRKAILNHEYSSSSKLIVLDEIHKYARWRNLLKGCFDEYVPETNFLVTGSARLDHYRKGGDSLLGRYHYYRLHPFSLPELSPDPKPEDLERLMLFGGFPEPLFSESTRVLRRWHLERMRRVIREDLRDLERVKEISLIELLVDALPARVGSPLSVKSLAEDLEVAPQTVESWIRILENLYLCYRIPPFGAPKIRAVKKERKLYLWDWSQVESTGARFENLVAGHLLKWCHFVEDTEGYRMDLRYIRDTDGREIDFVVLRNSKPIFAVECKSGEKEVSPAIRYFRERTPIPKFYQVHTGTKDYGSAQKGCRVLPFVTFCREEALV